MTTNPTARRFRIRRGAPGDALADALGSGLPGLPSPAPAPCPAPPPTPAPASVAGAAPRAAASGVAAPGAAAPAAGGLDAIRREGLTGAQLRSARRVAQRHNLSPSCDLDAVRLLRAAGIDPFQRGSLLAAVPRAAPGPAAAPCPGTAPPPPPAESAEPAGPVDRRAAEILKMQADIQRRRRRRQLLLGLRLFAFVVLPALLAGLYLHLVATPMYATQSEFVIQQADARPSGGLGEVLANGGLSSSQESIAVQSYLGSREAMLRLDADRGFRAVFSDPALDWWQRLPADASAETAYALYRKRVTIGYDPSEGLVRLEVVAPTPAASEAFSRALIGYAEEQVDSLTARLRADQVAGARALFEESERAVARAQARVLDLQEKAGMFDPASEGAALLQQVAGFEGQLAEKRLQLDRLLGNARPNAARVRGAEGDVARLEALVADLRAQLTQSTAAGESIARVSGELKLAEAELATRTAMMQEALQALQSARLQADRQARYLAIGVSPVPPDEASYPRAGADTLLALLLCAGLYLMVSVTVSILREQV